VALKNEMVANKGLKQPPEDAYYWSDLTISSHNLNKMGPSTKPIPTYEFIICGGSDCHKCLNLF
jgi:hypothetical protein